jgi:phage tail sheath gpL-like
MTIPTAVSPSTLTPGLYLKVNLLAGAGSVSSALLRALIIASKATTGTLVNDTELRTGGGEETAGVAFGPGTPGHLCAKQLYAASPNAIVDFISPIPGAGAAVATITLSGAPTENTGVEVIAKGVTFDVGWLVGETPDNVRDKLIIAANSRTDKLPFVATSGGTGIVTLTFKTTGRIGNDCKIRCRLTVKQSGTEAVVPTTMTNFTGGSTDPDVTNALETAQGREYHYIVPCLSNTDACTTGSSSNVERILQHIQLYNEGIDAKLQQIIYGSTSSQALAEAAAVARNVGYCQHVLCVNAGSLPCEFAGAEAGDRLSFIGSDPAANRIGNVIGSNLYGSADVATDKPTPTQTESAIGNGVSIISYDMSENLVAVRPVTTYSQNSVGGPDRRLLDTQNVDAAYIIARDLRSALPAEFPNAKIQKDSAPGADPAPAGVIEERDVKTFVISRLRAWQRGGVILQSALDAAIEAGTLAVEVNASDPSQVDILVPLQVIPPLAKFGVVVNREPVV